MYAVVPVADVGTAALAGCPEDCDALYFKSTVLACSHILLLLLLSCL
jgi:hypothetical protein